MILIKPIKEVKIIETPEPPVEGGTFGSNTIIFGSALNTYNGVDEGTYSSDIITFGSDVETYNGV